MTNTYEKKKTDQIKGAPPPPQSRLLNPMRLSSQAIERIRGAIEAGYAVGDRQVASDIQVLLDFYLKAIGE